GGRGRRNGSRQRESTERRSEENGSGRPRRKRSRTRTRRVHGEVVSEQSNGQQTTEQRRRRSRGGRGRGRHVRPESSTAPPPSTVPGCSGTDDRGAARAALLDRGQLLRRGEVLPQLVGLSRPVVVAATGAQQPVAVGEVP